MSALVQGHQLVRSGRVIGAVGVRSFRRFTRYRLATAAGCFTNTVFGFIFAGVLLTLWRLRPNLGGYDSTDAVTFVFLQQALLATTGVMGAETTTELAERVRDGRIGVDLYRPTPLVGWWFGQDAGRAAFHLITRGSVPVIVGALVLSVRWPHGVAGWLLTLVSLVLAWLVSFGLRYTVALAAFWTVDNRGLEQMAMVAAMLLSGMVMPLVVFPGVLGRALMFTPWACLLQLPANIWLGRQPGGAGVALAVQAGWAAVLLLLANVVTRRATRRVVVSGG